MLFKIFTVLLFSYVSYSTCLPKDKHRDFIFMNCIRCHSDKIICQQNLNKKRWDQTITWMEEKHNLVINPPNIRPQIISYLHKHFGEKKDSSKILIGRRNVNPLP